MSDNKKLIGERISSLRKARHMTQSELAERVGIDSQHVSRLETGKYYPSFESLELMAKALDVELREFFEFPTVESDQELRQALIGIANTAPRTVLRELVPVARNLMGRQPPSGDGG